MIEKYTGFILSQYQDAFPNHLFKKQVSSEHLVEIANTNVAIQFWTELYEKEGLGMTLIDKRTDTYYDLSGIAQNFGFDDYSFISEQEYKIAEEFHDPIKELIYVSILIMSKFGLKTLDGDFSDLKE